MKVFDLQCEHGHRFEGWFASHDDYDSQLARGLLSCPICNSVSVERQVSAARLNVSRHSAPTPAPLDQAQALQALRALVRSSENLGAGFAAEARRIHAGEAPERMIRGTASPEERRELAEEGVAVLPLPAFLDDDALQ